MPTLENECEQAVGRLRVALIGLYDDVGADPASPQDVARTLRVNKTLTYNMAKLLQQGDGLAAIPHVPGNSSIERFLKAAASVGADRRLVEEVREATQSFSRIVADHVGDRATLDLVIDGITSADGSALEQSSKRAYQGNSGIYGVQAATNLMSCFLAPNPDDEDQLDMVMLRGLLGVRRLRSQIRVPIFRSRQWSESGQAVGSKRWEPIDKSASSPFLHEFNRGDVPEIDAVEAPRGTDYVIRPGPIGNKAAFDCFFGDMIRAGASRYGSQGDTTGEFGITVTVPSQRLIFDLTVHRDIPFVLDAKSMVYAYFFTTAEREGKWDEASLLPMRTPSTPLAGSPPAVATARVPKYTAAHRMVYDRMGWNPRDFVGSRLEIGYPPLGSTVVRRFALPDRP